VDGVLTDGGIILYGQDGEAKRFDVQDGMGINLARVAGIKVGIITARSSEVVRRRAMELHIDEVVQGASNKSDALQQLLVKYGLVASQSAYIGDDIQDIPIMRQVGIPIAVQNARPLVKQCSKYVTTTCGGHGAVREAIEWLLELRGGHYQVYESIIGQNVASLSGK
jgi:3-deoxy-D-manno-octulosonate 8-phosphate phosphatase (KDO 8-P phosphatase)